MPKRSQIATREYLKQIPLPIHASTYTVISHETVIANALEQLKLKGFKVIDERYRTNSLGEVAVGVYELTYGDDPDLGMMFAWANSYDKTMRFKCAVGGLVKSSRSCIIQGDFSWGRKHTGTADSEMISQVTNQITNGQIYYDAIVEVKEEMKALTIHKIRVAETLGRAFFMNSLFSKEQMGIVYDELAKPSFDYNADPNSVWTYYNHMLVALQKAHPRTWMEEQRDLHKYICSEFNIVTKTVAMHTIAQTAVNLVLLPTAVLSPLEILQEIVESKVEELVTENLQEIGTNVETYLPEKKSNFETVITSPDDSNVSDAEQALIDQRIADLDKVSIKVPNLNLPD